MKRFNVNRPADAKYEPFPSDFIIAFEGVIEYISEGGRNTRQPIEEFLEKVAESVFLITAIQLNVSSTFSKTYRFARRAQNSHAIVNAGFSITLENHTVRRARLYFGAIDILPMIATKTVENVTNRAVGEIDVAQIVGVLRVVKDRLLKVNHYSEYPLQLFLQINQPLRS